MLVTALTVRAATSVKSGPAASVRLVSADVGCDVAAGVVDGAGTSVGAAVARSAVHMRPVMTSPITKPALTSNRVSSRRRMV